MDLAELRRELFYTRDRMVHFIPGQVLAICLILVPSEQQQDVVELHY